MIKRVEEMVAVGGDLDHSKLNQLGMSLKEELEEIKDLDSETVALIGDEELEDEIAQTDLYKERIYSILILIEKATEPMPATTTAAPSTTATPTPTSTSTHSNKVRLSKLTVKSFNGKLTA